jgi:hypothetical protein
MLGNPQFQNNLFRQYLNVFGEVFRGITISRYSNTNVEIQRLSVPVFMAARQKWYATLTQNPLQEEKVAVQLPIISYDMTAMEYLFGQQSYPYHRNYTPVVNYDTESTFKAVPYKLNMQLNIMFKNQDDGFHIIEQMLPFFTPDLSISVNVMGDMNYVDDLFIVFKSITKDDTYDSDIEDRRLLIYTIEFDYYINLYANIKDIPVIKDVILNFRLPVDFTEEEIAKANTLVQIETIANTDSNTVVITQTINEYIDRSGS